MDNYAIEVENVSKKFSRSLKRSLFYGFQDVMKELLFQKTDKKQLRESEFWSLKDISFKVEKGKMLGLTGLNGAGKSTLLKLINGLFKPDQGYIKIRGRVGALIELGTGFNPILSGRENIYINASVLGMTKKEIDSKVNDIIEFSELDEFIDSPIKTYSSGMLARLGFSVAVHLEPDILLIDEILSVGDATFREKSFKKLMSFKKNGGTIILVSHLARNIENFCDDALLLEKGMIVAKGSAINVMEEYQKRSMQIMLDKKKDKHLHLTNEEENDIVLRSCVTINKENLETNKIEYGDNFTIKVQYEALKSIFNPSFSFTLYKNEVSVSNLDMHQIGVEINQLNRMGEISCVIKSPNLAPGIYDIGLGILTLNTAAKGKKYYFHPTKIATFIITPDNLKNKYIKSTPYDLYRMDPSVILSYEWNLEKINIL